MIRSSLAASLLLGLPTVALAQDGDAAVADQQQAQAAYDGLVKAYTQAFSAWQKEAMAAMAEARRKNQPRPAIAMNPPSKKFITQARELATEHAGEDVAILFHGFVLKYATKETEQVKKTLATLTLDHSESAQIGEALANVETAVRMGCEKEVMDLFSDVIEFNEHAAAKASAHLQRGKLRLQNARSDAAREAAQQDLESVAKLTKDEKLCAAADEALFEIRHLQVGCEAPDIAATDVDGTKFKLSDYRGKVVLLDFWGFW